MLLASTQCNITEWLVVCPERAKRRRLETREGAVARAAAAQARARRALSRPFLRVKTASHRSLLRGRLLGGGLGLGGSLLSLRSHLEQRKEVVVVSVARREVATVYRPADCFVECVFTVIRTYI